MFDWITWPAIGTTVIATILVSYIPSVKKAILWFVRKLWYVFSRIWENDTVRKWKIGRRINKNEMTVGDVMYVLKHTDSFSKDKVDKVVRTQKKAMKLAMIPNIAVTPASEVLEKTLAKLKSDNTSSQNHNS